MKKIYTIVKQLLETDSQTRNSDKYLQWQVLKKQGLVRTIEWFDGTKEVISKDQFISKNTISLETVRRTRQKIQETCKELEATSSVVRVKRKQKSKTGGNFIYSEGWN